MKKIIVLLICLLGFGVSLYADRVHFKSGASIGGKVTETEGGIIIWRGGYSRNIPKNKLNVSKK